MAPQVMAAWDNDEKRAFTASDPYTRRIRVMRMPGTKHVCTVWPQRRKCAVCEIRCISGAGERISDARAHGQVVESSAVELKLRIPTAIEVAGEFTSAIRGALTI
jgi:hypothetical protein